MKILRLGLALGGALGIALALSVAGCHESPVRRQAAPTTTIEPLPEPSAVIPPSTPPKRPSAAELLALPDATPRSEPRARLGNPAFYEVYGQRYTVLAQSHGYLERGVASWYGPDFHGEKTSTGESYDMFSMTAAHRTLPLPAYAHVTNLRNGHSVVVRVNDRGPFKANRIIDLSYAAALKLDMVREGTTLVEVEAIDPQGPVPAAPRPSDLYAQAGAFSVAANAQKLRERLAGQGIANVQVQSDTSRDPPWYRVRVGPIRSVADYDATVARLKALGIPSPTLVAN